MEMEAPFDGLLVISNLCSLSRKYLIFPEKFPRFPDSRLKSPDSGNKFVFLPKQLLLELSPPPPCLLTLFHISFEQNRSLDMELLYGQRGTYRQVSNARSRGIIADYCVFNSMQHQKGL